MPHALTDTILNATCPNLHSDDTPTVPGHIQVSQSVQNASQACVSKIGETYHELITYQPAHRYWTFQWYELGIYAAAALLIGAFCVWWVRRRRIA